MCMCVRHVHVHVHVHVNVNFQKNTNLFGAAGLASLAASRRSA